MERRGSFFQSISQCQKMSAALRLTLDEYDQMIADGATKFTEAGPGKVLQGLINKIDRSVQTEGVS